MAVFVLYGVFLKYIIPKEIDIKIDNLKKLEEERENKERLLTEDAKLVERSSEAIIIEEENQ